MISDRGPLSTSEIWEIIEELQGRLGRMDATDRSLVLRECFEKPPPTSLDKVESPETLCLWLRTCQFGLREVPRKLGRKDVPTFAEGAWLQVQKEIATVEDALYDLDTWVQGVCTVDTKKGNLP